MISFATLFLGLVFGVVNVQLVAAHGVATVELRLDGRAVATLREPWTAPLDLGAGLAPHELVAVAFDAAGRETGRVRQWINRPRSLAEAGFVLEPLVPGQRRIAHLTWRCLVQETPASIRVSFDGKPLVVTDPARFELPLYVPEQLHFLRAELDFGDGVTAVADASFGGRRKAEALASLTAVPVVLDEGRDLPDVEGLTGWFAADGGPVRAAAVEEGPADVALVVAEGARAELWRLRPPGSRSSRVETSLRKDQWFRFVGTVPDRVEQVHDVVSVFPTSQELSWKDGGILTIGAGLKWPTVPQVERIARAVAAAALTAAGRDRRRAVVLLLGPDSADAGEVTPEAAARYLQELRVPLFVWSVGSTAPPLASRFGRVVDASTRARFVNAVQALSDHLERQRIVWVEGELLPQTIELTGKAEGLSLAR